MIREFVNTEDLMKHYIKNKINTFIKAAVPAYMISITAI